MGSLWVLLNVSTVSVLGFLTQFKLGVEPTKLSPDCGRARAGALGSNDLLQLDHRLI